MERSNKPKLLIVDDESVNRELLERIFIQKYQLFKADGATSAMAILEGEPDIAVVISDQNMPKISGTELLGWVAESKPDTIRILMTARTDTQDLIEAINTSKIFKFVPKPFKREELVTIVQQAVETHRVLRARTASLRTNLEAAEARYQNLFENAVEGIFQTDSEGYYQLVNPKMAEILGYGSPADVLESSPPIRRQFSLDQTYEEFFYLLKSDTSVSNFEAQIIQPDGTKKWISLNVRMLCDQEGNVLSFEGTAQDISLRKQAEVGVQVLQTIILEAGSAADLLTALNLSLQHICAYTGWTPGEAWIPSLDQQTLRFTTACHTIDPSLEAFQQIIPDLVLSQSDNLVAQVWRTKSPQWIWHLDQLTESAFGRKQLALDHGLSSCVAFPIRSKHQVVAVLLFFVSQSQGIDSQLVGLINAITTQLGAILQRKRDEEEIRRMNQELSLARDQALESSRTKSAFMATMSHELRTPLNAIIGYSEMLQEDARDEGRDDIVADLHKIYTAGKQLLDLINDILDISKIEAGKMELYLEEFSIPHLIREIVDVVLPLTHKNHNQLNVVCDESIGTIFADMAKVRQCLINLLTNASKFTQNGTITLSIDRKISTSEAWVTFTVKDTGIGIAEETLQRLFQPFTQADSSTTRKYGGTGLGLAITKRFCQMMGGDITVESALQQGSTFKVFLPVTVKKSSSEAPPPQAPPLEDDIPEPRQPVVLVIDDDPYVHDLIKRFLNKHGFAVKMARNGLDGIRLAREIMPDAITLDVVMPGMDGWNVLGILKADAKTSGIPIIMITIDDTKEAGYALGVTDFLTKPINRNRLLTALDQLRKRDPLNPDSLTDCKVLIVEDEPDARQVLTWMLQKEGCIVVEAENGQVALESIIQSTPDLILLDLMMPEMDGFQFIERLRREYPGWLVPIIVITAMSLSQKDKSRLNGSVQKILQKGACTMDELLREIHRLLPQPTPDGQP